LGSIPIRLKFLKFELFLNKPLIHNMDALKNLASGEQVDSAKAAVNTGRVRDGWSMD
jgi:hypothetical protein